MAKKTKKEKSQKILNYEIAREETLLANWELYGISQNKIDRLKAKNDRHKQKKNEVDAS